MDNKKSVSFKKEMSTTTNKFNPSEIPLSSGEYGDTFLHTDEQGHTLVCKKFKDPTEDFMMRSDFIREINALVNLKDVPNIIGIKDFDLENKGTPVIFMEAGKQSLEEYLQKNSSKPISKQMMFEIVKGMYLMSQHGIWHRDLKPQNIVLTQDESVRIIDFGLARMGPHEDHIFSGRVYTLWYRPPEIILRNVLSDKGIQPPDFIYDGDKCDIWSIAMVFLDMLSSKSVGGTKRMFKKYTELETLLEMVYTFGKDNILSSYGKDSVKEYTYINSERFIRKLKASYIIKDVQTYRLPKRITNCTQIYDTQLYHLLEGMMHPNPQKRFSYNQIIHHPYFAFQIPININNIPVHKHRCEFKILSKDVDSLMYTTLSNWLYTIHLRFKLKKVTFIQGMALIRILLNHDVNIRRTELQLYACICMQLACNLYEVFIPEIRDWVVMCDSVFTEEIFNEKGYDILKMLGGNINVYSVYDELRKICKEFTTLNGILTAVAFCDTIGLHYSYKSEMTVLEKAIEIYNDPDPNIIEKTIEDNNLFTKTQKDNAKKHAKKHFQSFFEKNEKQIFCMYT